MMNRRTYVKTVIAGAAAKAAAAQAPAKPAAKRPIELHLDFTVAPATEKKLLDHFSKTFRPTASKQPGFMRLDLLKLGTVMQGPAYPKGVNYRFVLRFESEELRQQWIKRPVHQEVWPPIEAMMIDKKYPMQMWEVSEA
jgi:hypothetical protein